MWQLNVIKPCTSQIREVLIRLLSADVLILKQSAYHFGGLMVSLPSPTPSLAFKPVHIAARIFLKHLIMTLPFLKALWWLFVAKDYDL